MPRQRFPSSDDDLHIKPIIITPTTVSGAIITGFGVGAVFGPPAAAVGVIVGGIAGRIYDHFVPGGQEQGKAVERP